LKRRTNEITFIGFVLLTIEINACLFLVYDFRQIIGGLFKKNIVPTSVGFTIYDFRKSIGRLFKIDLVTPSV